MFDLAENYKVSRNIASGGMVLLKNDDKLLPFTADDRIGVVGNGAVDLIKGGGGSANVKCEYVRTLLYGFNEKAKEGKIKFDDNSFHLAEQTEYYSVELLNELAKSIDTAIFVYKRYGTEGEDRPLGEKGTSIRDGDNKKLVNFYPYKEELELLENIEKSNIKKVLLILNVSSVVDFSFINDFPKIKAVLLSSLPGMECGTAIADILVGDVTPSGKLVDTVAYDYADYPTSKYFNVHPRISEYKEGVFVGYRYFETFAKEKVMYPFGYGLSYTTFEYSDYTVKVCDHTVNVTLKVTNTGDTQGREVVQVYVNAPSVCLEKPFVELRAFAKTGNLLPGESEIVNISFKVKDMASFDHTGVTGYAGCYVLEAGEYKIYVGKNVRDIYLAGTYKVDKTYPAEVQKVRFSGAEYEFNLAFDNNIYTTDKKLSLYDVANGEMTLRDFVNYLTPEELVSLALGQPLSFVEGTSGLGNLRKYDVPNPQTADGPAGIRRAVNTTCFPCATLIACSWDKELQERMGHALGFEGFSTGIDVILGPAMNIHRDPRGGRCFEYFSEDPLVSGKTAAAIVRGIESEGFLSTLKHYAANSCEYNRCVMDSVVDERTLREIYLKGFEIAVKEGNPAFIMTSYNIVNGRHASDNIQLLRGMLRDEWNYEGATMTDWRNGVPLASEIVSGNNIKMPFGYPDEGMKTLDAYNRGDIPLSILRDNAYYVLYAVMKSRAFKQRDFGIVHKLVGDELYIPAMEVNGLASSRIAHAKRDDGTTYLYRLNREQRNQRSFLNYVVDVENGGEFEVTLEISTNCPETQIWFFDENGNKLGEAWCDKAVDENKWYFVNAKIKLNSGENFLKVVFANEPYHEYEFFFAGADLRISVSAISLIFTPKPVAGISLANLLISVSYLPPASIGSPAPSMYPLKTHPV